MTDVELLTAAGAILVAIAWRILDVGELLRRGSPAVYDPSSRPIGKGW